MNFEIQFARITNNGKLPDRFLTCQHTKSLDLAKASMGDIFALVEILSPWFPTAQIGQAIINNFSKSYFQGGSTSDLLNFEESLKYVNESLAQATQNGETDWIGNLNSILAVITEGSLHIASSGKSQAYIFRDGKINHLTEGLSNGTEIHPLKTFSNIISGELKPHDKILITNRDLFDHLSLESVRQIIALNNPSTAALQIVKLLKKAHAKNVNLIIINLFTQDELSNEIVGQNIEEVFYLDKSTDSIFSKIKSFWTTLASPLGKIAGAKLRKSKEKLLRPKIEEKPTVPAPANPDKFHKEFLSNNSRDDILLKDEEISYSPDFVHYYKEQKKYKENNLKNFTATVSKILRFIYEKIALFIGFLVKTSRDPERRKYLYIGIAIFLILIIGLVIFVRGRGTKVGNLESQKILDQAIAAEKDGLNALSAGNESTAKEKFAIAVEKATSIKDAPLVSKDAATVLKETYQKLDKLTSTTRYESLSPLNSVTSDAKNLFVLSGDAFFITDDAIYKASLLGGSPSKAATLPKGKGNFATGFRAAQLIYLYTSNQMVFQFDTSTNKLDQLMPSSGKWETANSIAYYSNSLYLLDGVLGQVYKHASDQKTFAAGDTYISTTNINLKKSISIAIDGNVYVLKNNGNVDKISRSKLQDFSLKNIPSPFDTIAEPLKIFTDADTPSIYLLDKSQKRILEFDKDGVFVRQFALPNNFENIKDFYVSAKSRKIWVLNDNSVFELSI